MNLPIVTQVLIGIIYLEKISPHKYNNNIIVFTMLIFQIVEI